MNEMPDRLLGANELAPVTVHNENGRSPFLIVADHAGNFVPRSVGSVFRRLNSIVTSWDLGIAAGLRAAPRKKSRRC
jgi:predicted N-formylglutamate amidohydrolase